MIKCPNCNFEFSKFPKGFEKNQVWGSWKLTGKVKTIRYKNNQPSRLMQSFCVICNAEKWAQINNLKRKPLCRNCYNGMQRGRNKHGFHKKEHFLLEIEKILAHKQISHKKTFTSQQEGFDESK